jgi:hypothetical protein
MTSAHLQDCTREACLDAEHERDLIARVTADTAAKIAEWVLRDAANRRARGVRAMTAFELAAAILREEWTR